VFSRIAKLYERATGGSAIAADPNNQLDEFWPRASDAAGVAPAIEWFKHRSDAGERSLLFLVGSPGGGKSHVAAQMVSGMKEINPKITGLARRAHLYQAGPLEVLLVNDATIEESRDFTGSLNAEITECLDLGRSLIACVNRGILVEEMAKLSSLPTLSGDILSWLSTADSEFEALHVETLASSDYFKHGRLKTSTGEVLELCAVYVDACSLLEKSPNPEFKPSEDGLRSFELPAYRLTKQAKRSTFTPGTVAGTDLIHEAVLALIADNSQFPSGIFANPVQANLENLSNFQLVNSLTSCMRAAEIGTGQRFTFREIWGVVSRSVIGDLHVTTSSEDLEQTVLDLQPTLKSSFSNFSRMQILGSLRFHQALFGVQGDSTLATELHSNPILKIMKFMDPIRDSQPGFFDVNHESSGWVTPLLDAFTGSFSAVSPLQSILNQVSSNSNDLFPSAVTEFEWQLDNAFTSLMSESDMKDIDRNRAIRWYSTYLSRLYAVSNGFTAFREQVGIWIQLWSTAPALPVEIEKQFMSMLRPRRTASQDDGSYIPLFDSRTMAITENPSFARLAARLSDLRASTMRDGDSLVLVLREHGLEVADILLDFALLRDALVCTPDHIGASDVSGSNAPRLERLRAARLTPAMLAKKSPLSILLHDTVTEVVVVK
jgi:hypothetical protein